MVGKPGRRVISPGAVVRYSGTGSAFVFEGNTNITIFGTLIYTQRMILKGSNAPAAWTPLQAEFDALDQFVADGKGVLGPAVVEEVQVEYRVPLLEQLIGNRIASGAYTDNPGLFTAEYSELRQYANQSILQQVQSDYYVSQKVQPTPWYVPLYAVLSNGLVDAVIAGLVVAYVAYRRRWSGPPQKGLGRGSIGSSDICWKPTDA